MRKLIVHCDNSKSVGCDVYQALLVEANTPEDEIDKIAWEMSVEWASSYFNVLWPEFEEDEDDDEEVDYENSITTDQIESTWEDYVPEVHDMLRMGGGSFEQDFI